jgi:hypothetical protein
MTVTGLCFLFGAREKEHGWKNYQSNQKQFQTNNKAKNSNQKLQTISL